MATQKKELAMGIEISEKLCSGAFCLRIEHVDFYTGVFCGMLLFCVLLVVFIFTDDGDDDEKRR